MRWAWTIPILLLAATVGPARTPERTRPGISSPSPGLSAADPSCLIPQAGPGRRLRPDPADDLPRRAAGACPAIPSHGAPADERPATTARPERS